MGAMNALRSVAACVLLFLCAAIIPLSAAEILLPGSETIWLGTSRDLHDQVFLPAYGYTFPPFDTSGSAARIVRTTAPLTLVRFYTPGISGPLGAWATVASEVRGLTAEQVWDRLALPQAIAPTTVSMMVGPTRNIAPGTQNTGAWLVGGPVSAGLYTEGSFSKQLNGGAYQYFILGPNKPAGMVATLTSAEYGVPAVVFAPGNYTTGLVLNQDGTNNQGRNFAGGIPVFSYLYSAGQAAGSRNVRNMAAALDRLNPQPGTALYSALYQPLDVLWIRGDDVGLTAALQRINPEKYGAVVLSRLYGMAGLADALESYRDADEAGRKDGSWRLWSSTDGRTSALDGWQIAEGRLIVGADRRWTKRWRTGALLGGGIARTKWDNAGRAHATNFDMGVYAVFEPSEPLLISLAGLGGIGWIDSRRSFTLLDRAVVAGTTPFGSLAFLPDPRTPRAEFNAFDSAAHFAASYDLRVQRISLKPRLQLDGLFSSVQDFMETGAGALNLAYQEMGDQALRVRADLMISSPPAAGRRNGFEPWLQAGVTRYQELGSASFAARFAEGMSEVGRFVVNRTSLDRTSGLASAGLRWHLGSWTLSGQADGEWGGIRSYGGRLTVVNRF